MAARNKPYEQFGPFILFKKLESDAIGELWRAARVVDGSLGQTLALRRLTGGNRQMLAASAEFAGHIVPQLTGPSFVRAQSAGVIDGVAWLAWEYAGGRSLRHIIERGRGGRESSANPLPLDQAIAIAEKVAFSLATMADLRDGSGTRLCHGALLPQFIWITDDGEIRVAGQQLGAGIAASLVDPRVAADIGGYFSPEYRGGAQAAKDTDVYSLGAMLFLLVTGNEPPDGSSASAFGAAVRAAKTMSGGPIPDDIRVVLDKSLNLDPSMRFPSIGDMKQAISGLAHSGKYTATTFNLAFYLSTLLKKDIENEAVEREREAKVNLTPYLEPQRPEPSTPLPPHEIPAMFSAAAEAPKKSRTPLVIGAVVLVAAVAAAAYFLTRGKTAPQGPAQATATARPAAPPRVISEPVVASASTAPATTATDTAGSEEAQKKAFEDAVRAKLQAEMMKLQNQFMTELKKGQSKDAPVPAAPAAEERIAAGSTPAEAPRREPAASRPEPVAEQPAAPAVATATQAPAPAPQQAAPVPAQAAAPAVREGDVVDIGSLDSIPRPLRPIALAYPAMARQQRISATIIVSAFIDETGSVTDVRVLRGEPRFGLNDAAIRAMRATKFSPAVKDGKRVRTWYPQTIEFRP